MGDGLELTRGEMTGKQREQDLPSWSPESPEFLSKYAYYRK